MKGRFQMTVATLSVEINGARRTIVEDAGLFVCGDCGESISFRPSEQSTRNCRAGRRSHLALRRAHLLPKVAR